MVRSGGRTERVQLGKQDVLLGRGSRIDSHPGNRRLRSIVKKHSSRYLSARKQEKMPIAEGVIRRIRRTNPPARFLKCITDGRYVIVSDQKALDKVSQALRDHRRPSSPSTTSSASTSSSASSRDEMSCPHLEHHEVAAKRSRHFPTTSTVRTNGSVLPSSTFPIEDWSTILRLSREPHYYTYDCSGECSRIPTGLASTKRFLWPTFQGSMEDPPVLRPCKLEAREDDSPAHFLTPTQEKVSRARSPPTVVSTCECDAKENDSLLHLPIPTQRNASRTATARREVENALSRSKSRSPQDQFCDADEPHFDTSLSIYWECLKKGSLK